MNGNQNRDPGEPLLRGALITLKNSSNTQVGSFVSYDTGARCFTNLPADTYTVIEGPNPPAFVSTTTDTWPVVLASGGSAQVILKEINTAPIWYGAPVTVAVNQNTNKVYVAMYSSSGGRVAAIDAVTLSVQMLPTGDGTTGVAVNPSLNQLYVTPRDSQLLQVFDVSPGAYPGIKIQDVLLGGQAYFVQAKPSTNQVYLTLAFDPPDLDRDNSTVVLCHFVWRDIASDESHHQQHGTRRNDLGEPRERQSVRRGIA